MFNYFRIAHNLITIAYSNYYDFETFQNRDYLYFYNDEPTTNKGSKYVIQNQETIFKTTKLTKDQLDSLLHFASIGYRYDKEIYNNGNLDIIPLDILIDTTKIESIPNFIDNLNAIQSHFYTHFVSEDKYKWFNKILNAFYIFTKNDHVDTEIINKFELNDSDLKLIYQLKR